MNEAAAAIEPRASVRWQPLESAERRVLGVLVEKAKTTPENYPLSLHALRTGCNQKSNRAPLMQFDDDQVEMALESLRRVGAVVVVQGSGRVDKYRHLAYDWLGVEKVELAVMAELLLRGAQTVGELRGRAARMEPIKDLGQLRPLLDALEAKHLIVYMTPPGRGCVVTHALYQDREMEKLRREATTVAIGQESQSPVGAAVSDMTQLGDSTSPPSTASPAAEPSDVAELAREVAELRAELAAVKSDFRGARAEFDATAQQLRHELDELNRQLGN